MSADELFIHLGRINATLFFQHVCAAPLGDTVPATLQNMCKGIYNTLMHWGMVRSHECVVVFNISQVHHDEQIHPVIVTHAMQADTKVEVAHSQESLGANYVHLRRLTQRPIEAWHAITASPGVGGAPTYYAIYELPGVVTVPNQSGIEETRIPSMHAPVRVVTKKPWALRL